MMNDKWVCRCEARRNRGEYCQLCMGRRCWNRTYEYRGTEYKLVEAILLWGLGYWDGPVSGISVYKSLPCFAESHTIFRDRSFWLYPLTTTEWKEELIARGRWLDTQLRTEIDRTKYMKRNPLGFFRLSSWGNPLECNRLPIHKIEEFHPELFKEVQS